MNLIDLKPLRRAKEWFWIGYQGKNKILKNEANDSFLVNVSTIMVLAYDTVMKVLCLHDGIHPALKCKFANYIWTHCPRISTWFTKSLSYIGWADANIIV